MAHLPEARAGQRCKLRQGERRRAVQQWLLLSLGSASFSCLVAVPVQASSRELARTATATSQRLVSAASVHYSLRLSPLVSCLLGQTSRCTRKTESTRSAHSMPCKPEARIPSYWACTETLVQAAQEARSLLHTRHRAAD